MINRSLGLRLLNVTGVKNNNLYTRYIKTQAIVYVDIAQFHQHGGSFTHAPLPTPQRANGPWRCV